MMLMPRRNFDLFGDDFFNDDFFGGKDKSTFNLMKTDVKETENSYLLEVDLPGYTKDNIKIDVEDGYLTINAKMNREENEEEKGKYVRRERFTGEMSRSFYVGDEVEVEDVKASFRNGILNLEVPKIDSNKKSSEKKYVEISD